MAAQIYSPPEGMEFEYDYTVPYQEQLKAEHEWLEKLRQFCKDNGSGKYAGKEIRDHVADGYARYMIFSLRPLVLIHLPLGDAWRSRWDERWTAADVRQMADHMDNIKTMFGQKS